MVICWLCRRWPIEKNANTLLVLSYAAVEMSLLLQDSVDYALVWCQLWGCAATVILSWFSLCTAYTNYTKFKFHINKLFDIYSHQFSKVDTILSSDLCNTSGHEYIKLKKKFNWCVACISQSDFSCHFSSALNSDWLKEVMQTVSLPTAFMPIAQWFWKCKLQEPFCSNPRTSS